ncbi:MAG TPA: DUF488 domain-containing protein [Steroidobacteraceae bacterium]|jgi:uncharacterized protein (DUF488 family)|nr:DUF488 domain-containing protein [Steroidobacteraceae bacterium]
MSAAPAEHGAPPPGSDAAQAEILTIGHSTHGAEKFIELLRAHAVTALADVRSTPYSRRHPQFNRERLRDTLKAAGIEYVFLGKELGARSEDDACYEDDQVQYDVLAKTPAFTSGIQRLIEGSRKYRIATMCAEHEPLNCHRTILVARHLVRAGACVSHILRDGSIEPHTVTLARLVQGLRLTPADPDLFDLEASSVAEEAYARQGQRIAYRRAVT